MPGRLWSIFQPFYCCLQWKLWVFLTIRRGRQFWWSIGRLFTVAWRLEILHNWREFWPVTACKRFHCCWFWRSSSAACPGRPPQPAGARRSPLRTASPGSCSLRCRWRCRSFFFTVNGSNRWSSGRSGRGSSRSPRSARLCRPCTCAGSSPAVPCSFVSPNRSATTIFKAKSKTPSASAPAPSRYAASRSSSCSTAATATTCSPDSALSSRSKCQNTARSLSLNRRHRQGHHGRRLHL